MSNKKNSIKKHQYLKFKKYGNMSELSLLLLNLYNLWL